MATYTTNLDFIHGEIIPALGDYAADFDLDGSATASVAVGSDR